MTEARSSSTETMLLIDADPASEKVIPTLLLAS